MEQNNVGLNNLTYYFNKMPQINGKKNLNVEFGDSIVWAQVDLNCVVEFITAANNKV